MCGVKFRIYIFLSVGLNFEHVKIYGKQIQERHFPTKKKPCGALHNIAQGL